MNEQQTAPPIEGISLASFLQLLEHERKSCTLEVSNDNNSGRIYFHDGNLVDAEYGDLCGLDAAYAILSWDDASYYLTAAIERIARISLPLAHVILTASTLKDEKDDSSPPPAKPSTPANAGSALTRIINKLTAIPGVIQYYLLNRQGKLIAQSTKNRAMGDFIAYCIVSALQMREALGARGLHNIRIRMADGTTLLIVPASGATIGLMLAREASIEEVYPQLRKALTK